LQERGSTMARRRSTQQGSRQKHEQYEEAVAVENEPPDDDSGGDDAPGDSPDQPTVPDTLTFCTDSDIEHTDTLHIGSAHRTINRPFSPKERDRWVEQLVRSTEKLAELEEEKAATLRRIRERIKSRRADQDTATEKLREGKNLRSVRVECRWDYETRRYKEIAEDTREIIVDRELTLEEVVRFQQGVLPGCKPERWLSAEEALAQAAPENPEPAADWEDDMDELDESEPEEDPGEDEDDE